MTNQSTLGADVVVPALSDEQIDSAVEAWFTRPPGSDGTESEWRVRMRNAIATLALSTPMSPQEPVARYETMGYALAMRVMQSDLYPALSDRERAECDELIRVGQTAAPMSGGVGAPTEAADDKFVSPYGTSKADGTGFVSHPDHPVPAIPAVEVASGSDLESLVAKLDWSVRMLRGVADRGRAGLGESYPDVLQVLGAIKAALETLATPHPAVAVPAGLTDEQIDVHFDRWTANRLGAPYIKVSRERFRELFRAIAALAATSTTAPASVERQDLIDWAVGRWLAEVANRPLVNVHRRTLDDCWRQVLRHLGVNDRERLGPTHDELLAAPKEGEA